jgi:hypothetical protein
MQEKGKVGETLIFDLLKIRPIVNFGDYSGLRVRGSGSGFGVREIYEGWCHGFRHAPARTIGAGAIGFGQRLLS